VDAAQTPSTGTLIAIRCDGYAVVLASGGLDSTTLAYCLRDMGAKIRLLSFDYGQRHAWELECARQVAGALGVPHDVMDLRPVGAYLGGSARAVPVVPP
jgi:7-cyano-7-deazaguanine synthase